MAHVSEIHRGVLHISDSASFEDAIESLPFHAQATVDAFDTDGAAPVVLVERTAFRASSRRSFDRRAPQFLPEDGYVVREITPGTWVHTTPSPRTISRLVWR